MDTNPHYVYLIQTEEFFGSSIYKFGKTKRPFHERFVEYKRGVKIILIHAVFDCTRVEDAISQVFKSKYINRKGHEYFEGNIATMIYDIICICNIHGHLDQMFETNGSNLITENIPDISNISNLITKDTNNISNTEPNRELYDEFMIYIDKSVNGRKTAYLKAAKGILDSPTKIKNYHDAKKIIGIGDKIAKILDDKFIDTETKLSAISDDDRIIFDRFLRGFSGDDGREIKEVKSEISREHSSLFSENLRFSKTEFLLICNDHTKIIRKLYTKYIDACEKLYSEYPFAFYIYSIRCIIPDPGFPIHFDMFNITEFNESLKDFDRYTFNGLVECNNKSGTGGIFMPSFSRHISNNIDNVFTNISVLNEVYKLCISDTKVVQNFMRAFNNISNFTMTFLM